MDIIEIYPLIFMYHFQSNSWSTLETEYVLFVNFVVTKLVVKFQAFYISVFTKTHLLAVRTPKEGDVDLWAGFVRSSSTIHL